MLSIDFTKTAEEFPEQKPIWSALDAWQKQHPKVSAVPIVELLEDLGKEFSIKDIWMAISRLDKSGAARKRYRVVDPSMRVLLPESYEKWEDIPPAVPNKWDQTIEVEPHNIALVLESA